VANAKDISFGIDRDSNQEFILPNIGNVKEM